MDKISLDALAREQGEEAARHANGRAASTVVGGHDHVLRQTLIAMTAGTTLDDHVSPGEASVHVLHGRVRLTAGDRSWEGRDGDLIIVPDARHELHAIEASQVLLTVAKTQTPDAGHETPRKPD
jgi:quercetin dioxygenase-like cupin family protein